MTFPELKRTLAVFRSPEFGFFGFVMPTFRQTPFISGRLCNCGDVSLRARCAFRQPRRTWLYVALRGGEDVNVRRGCNNELCGIIREPLGAANEMIEDGRE